MSEYCTERREQRSERRRARRQRRHENRTERCQRGEWWNPSSWFCWIAVFFSYIWEWFWDTVSVWAKWLECVTCEIGLIIAGHRIISSDQLPEVKSIPKKNTCAFNNGTVGNKFHYNDSGVQYMFELIDGVVMYKRTDESVGYRVLKPHLDSKPLAISYTTKRRSNPEEAPEFDMISAGSGRILVKEKGKDNFYFTTIEDEFINGDKKNDNDVPGFYFKLYPQYNQDNVPELIWWNRDDYDHPSCDAYKMVPLGKHGLEIGLIAGVLAWGITTVYVPVVGPLLALPVGLTVGLLGAYLAGSVQDYMMIKVQPRVWHLLDTRPPFGSGAPPDWVETYTHITYGGKYFGICEKREEKSIRIHKVLDMAVGHMHRHIHYEDNYGGEMDTMYAPIYQIFNGPVDDKGGFCDGTCNFYILCQLKDDDTIRQSGHTKDAFGILLIDEQSYFSERWKLLHPDDNKRALFRDWALMGGNTGVKSPFWNTFFHHFDQKKFWCPFRNGCVNEKSRLAVSRQAVLVTGIDLATNEPILYSINFSWGTSDRTWRWRKYPCKEMEGTDYNESLEDIICYPQTIEIREDMTIFMKGINRIGEEYRTGYWYQKYLPADNVEVPHEEDLIENRKPNDPYPHEWKFITSSNFKLANRFSHFGVYTNVDSRSQYYIINLPPNSQFPDYPGNIPWVDLGSSLGIWSGKPPFWHSPPSMFNDRTYLTILKREPLGIIAIHWDKRDDELSGFSNKGVTLSSQAHMVLKYPTEYPTKNVKVTLSERKKLWRSPVVQIAKVIVDRNARKIIIMFYSRVAKSSDEVTYPDEASYTPRLDEDYAQQLYQFPLGDFSDYLSQRYQNSTDPVFPSPTSYDSKFSPDTSIWRVIIEGFDRNGDVYHVFDKNIWNNFERKSRYLYCYELESEEDFSKLAEYCGEEGVVEHGTSIWFEDFVGHVNTAEKIIYETVDLN